MNASLNNSAPHHLPAFVTTPGDTDVLALAAAAILVLAVLAVGLLFLRLHPARAHRP
ncbi:protein of unknown function [Methylorubrum extorquens DM4]|uniref:Uncharacterized protein n=1 Tax=Methylorubrum extorquens (strain DSM 6343 / CIP 106787 / DM4) TaxID=661410 RepID=C7CCJ3_METED|nr:protein of unknown function [Methylorubrum extorquens DM4]